MSDYDLRASFVVKSPELYSECLISDVLFFIQVLPPDV